MEQPLFVVMRGTDGNQRAFQLPKVQLMEDVAGEEGPHVRVRLDGGKELVFVGTVADILNVIRRDE